MDGSWHVKLAAPITFRQPWHTCGGTWGLRATSVWVAAIPHHGRLRGVFGAERRPFRAAQLLADASLPPLCCPWPRAGAATRCALGASAARQGGRVSTHARSCCLRRRTPWRLRRRWRRLHDVSGSALLGRRRLWWGRGSTPSQFYRGRPACPHQPRASHGGNERRSAGGVVLLFVSCGRVPKKGGPDASFGTQGVRRRQEHRPRARWRRRHVRAARLGKCRRRSLEQCCWRGVGRAASTSAGGAAALPSSSNLRVDPLAPPSCLPESSRKPFVNIPTRSHALTLAPFLPAFRRAPTTEWSS